MTHTLCFLIPIDFSPINHTFEIKQSELFAVSLYKTQISKLLLILAITRYSYIT
jgi:hypothetical protein